MTLYGTRHGETAWNAENKVCGRTDVPLNDKGREQARALAEKLAGLNIHRILTSPLSRVRETAAIIAQKCPAPVQVEPRLIEQDYGILEGTDRLGEDFLNHKRMFAFRYPGGESMMQLAGRIYPLLDELQTRYRDESLLLVCHGGICRVIDSYFSDLTNDVFFHFSMPNAGLLTYTR